MWTYRARAFEAVDGDTVRVDVDLGFRLTLRQTVRLAGINAAELTAPGGPSARSWLAGWLVDAHTVARANTDWPLIVTTRKHDGQGDKYGRWLASISRADGRDLATDMIAAGHAVAWDGHGAKPVAS